MKTKDKNLLWELSVPELQKQANDLNKQIVAELMKKQTKDVKNRRAGKLLRSRLAVIETIKRQKEMDEQLKNLKLQK